MAGEDWTLPALKAHFERLLGEHDKRYEERFKAQEKAVVDALAAVKEQTAAVKEQTKAQFDASEKAISKAEDNADKWRANANEWRSAMADREAKFAPRIEFENRLNALDAKINELREGSSRGVGAENQAALGRATNQYIGMLVVAVIGVAVAAAAYFAGRG